MRRLTVPAGEHAALVAAILEHRATFRFVAGGRSMRPFIRPGDVVTAERADSAALRPGDVILYRSGRGEVTAHRVFRVRREGGEPVFVARGDASPGTRERVPADRILARIVSLRRGARTIDLSAPTRRRTALARSRAAAGRFAAIASFRRALSRLAGAVRPSGPREKRECG